MQNRSNKKCNNLVADWNARVAADRTKLVGQLLALVPQLDAAAVERAIEEKGNTYGYELLEAVRRVAPFLPAVAPVVKL